MWICSKYHSLMPLLGGRQLLLPFLQVQQGPFPRAVHAGPGRVVLAIPVPCSKPSRVP